MGLNLDKCWECKYNPFHWCDIRAKEVAEKPGGIHACAECPLNLDDVTCHCLTIEDANQCARFEPKEDSNAAAH